MIYDLRFAFLAFLAFVPCLPFSASAATNIYISNLPITNNLVYSNRFIVEVGGLGTNSTQTITVGNLASNLLGGAEIWRTNWTAGAGAATLRTNTLFTFTQVDGRAAILTVDFLAIDPSTAESGLFSRSAGYYWNGGTVLGTGATAPGISNNPAALYGVFFTNSGPNVQVRGYGPDTATTIGRASLRILLTP